MQDKIGLCGKFPVRRLGMDARERAVGGNAVGEKKYLWAVAVFLVTAAISLAGLCLYNRIGKRHAQACAEDAGQAQPRRVFRRSHLRDRCFRRKSDRTP